MSHRLGVCSSCDAKYKIPSSFTAKQAKCKACGGVVNISDPEGAPKAAPPVPTRKVAPAPAKPAPKKQEMEEIQGSGKKRSGPSMKERLLAERKAAEAAASATKAPVKPAGRPARRPAAAKTAAAASEDAPKRSSRGKRAGGVSSRASRRPSATRGKKGRAKAGADVDENEESAPRSRGGRKKSSPLVPLMSIALILLAGVGVFLFMQGQDAPDTVSAGETETAAVDQATIDAEAQAAADKLAAEEAAAEKKLADEAAAADATAEETEKAKPKKEKKRLDPDSVDLTAIEDFGPVDGMSDDDFQGLMEKAKLAIDPEAGAAGNRAKKKLIESGRLAFPALLNIFKTLDFATDQGRGDGDVIQRALMDICGGKNFGWKYTTESADVYYNKKTVKAWADNWRKAQDDPAHWDKMNKKNKKKAEEAAAEDSMDDLDELDDL